MDDVTCVTCPPLALFLLVGPWPIMKGIKINGRCYLRNMLILRSPAMVPKFVKSSWRRPMCHGNLQPSCFGELYLQATSLWELVVLQLRGVVTSTVLGFDLSYYMIVGGKGMRRIEGRIMSVVNGESIVCVATKWRQIERRETRHNTIVKEVVLSIPPLQTRKNEDQSQHLWLLYKDLLKGGSTLKFGLSPLSSNWFLFWPMAYNRWNTNKWMGMMLLT